MIGALAVLGGLPWRLIGAGALVIALGFAGWKVNAWRNDAHELAAIKPAYEQMRDSLVKANKRVRELEAEDATATETLVDDLATEEATDRRVENAWERAPAVESPDESHPAVRLSDAWGVCFAAAAAGDSADREACEASAGDGALETGSGPGGL